MTVEYDSDFPENLSEIMLAGFRTTARGCTRPRVGMIGERKYIAKCGHWSEFSNDKHVVNEVYGDRFLRQSGLAVPPSRLYCIRIEGRFRQVRLAQFAEKARPLMAAWHAADAVLRERIRQQVVRTYPIQALIAGIDTFTYDNVLVDEDGTLLFVDNGASFDFRACGKRKQWFWPREDPDDPLTGYLSLRNHPDQHVLREILGDTPDSDLWRGMASYDLRSLPYVPADTSPKMKFKEYVRRLVERAKEVAG